MLCQGLVVLQMAPHIQVVVVILAVVAALVVVLFPGKGD